MAVISDCTRGDLASVIQGFVRTEAAQPTNLCACMHMSRGRSCPGYMHTSRHGGVCMHAYAHLEAQRSMHARICTPRGTEEYACTHMHTSRHGGVAPAATGTYGGSAKALTSLAVWGVAAAVMVGAMVLRGAMVPRGRWVPCNCRAALIQPGLDSARCRIIVSAPLTLCMYVCMYVCMQNHRLRPINLEG